ncbi:MAG: autotransporter outer membrane beta-barrel domain-containing protein [Pseudomonadota bacterium]
MTKVAGVVASYAPQMGTVLSRALGGLSLSGLSGLTMGGMSSTASIAIAAALTYAGPAQAQQDTSGCSSSGLGGVTVTCQGTVTDPVDISTPGSVTINTSQAVTFALTDTGEDAINVISGEDVSINDPFSQSTITGNNGIVVSATGTGSFVDIDVSGSVEGQQGVGLKVTATGEDSAVDIDLAGAVTGATDGIVITHQTNSNSQNMFYGPYGEDGVSLDFEGPITGANNGVVIDGEDSISVNFDAGDKVQGEDVPFLEPTVMGEDTVADGPVVPGAVTGTTGRGVDVTRTQGSGDVMIGLGDVTGGTDGVVITSSGDGIILVTAQGDVVGEDGEGIEIDANFDNDGAIVDVYGNVTGSNNGILVTQDGDGGVDINVTGNVTGTTGAGISVVNNAGFGGVRSARASNMGVIQDGGSFVGTGTSIIVGDPEVLSVLDPRGRPVIDGGIDVGLNNEVIGVEDPVTANVTGGTDGINVHTENGPTLIAVGGDVTGEDGYGIVVTTGEDGDGVFVTVDGDVTGTFDGINIENDGEDFGLIDWIDDSVVAGMTGEDTGGLGEDIGGVVLLGEDSVTIVNGGSVTGGEDGIDVTQNSYGGVNIAVLGDVTGTTGAGIVVTNDAEDNFFGVQGVFSQGPTLGGGPLIDSGTTIIVGVPEFVADFIGEDGIGEDTIGEDTIGDPSTLAMMPEPILEDELVASNVTGGTHGIDVHTEDSQTLIAVAGDVTGEDGYGILVTTGEDGDGVTISVDGDVTGTLDGINIQNGGEDYANLPKVTPDISLDMQGDVSTFGEDTVGVVFIGDPSVSVLNGGSVTGGEDGIDITQNSFGGVDIAVAGNVTGTTGAGIVVTNNGEDGFGNIFAGPPPGVFPGVFPGGGPFGGNGTTIIVGEPEFFADFMGEDYVGEDTIGDPSTLAMTTETVPGDSAAAGNVTGGTDGIDVYTESGTTLIAVAGDVTGQDGYGIVVDAGEDADGVLISVDGDVSGTVDGINVFTSDDYYYGMPYGEDFGGPGEDLVTVIADPSVLFDQSAGFQPMGEDTANILFIGGDGVNIATQGSVTGGEDGIQVGHNSGGAVDITVAGNVTGTTGTGIYVVNNGEDNFNVSDGGFIFGGGPTIDNGTTIIVGAPDFLPGIGVGIPVPGGPGNMSSTTTASETSTGNVTGGLDGIYVHTENGPTLIAVAGDVTGQDGYGVMVSSGEDADDVTVVVEGDVSATWDGINIDNGGEDYFGPPFGEDMLVVDFGLTDVGEDTGTITIGIGEDIVYQPQSSVFVEVNNLTAGEDGIAITNAGYGHVDVTITGALNAQEDGVDLDTDYGSVNTVYVEAGGSIAGNLAGGTLLNGANHAISDTDGDTQVTLSDGSALSGSISLGGGNDQLIIGAADISGGTVFDGGGEDINVMSGDDNFVDLLFSEQAGEDNPFGDVVVFNGDNSFAGEDLINWEVAVVGQDANLSLTDNYLSVGLQNMYGEDLGGTFLLPGSALSLAAGDTMLDTSVASIGGALNLSNGTVGDNAVITGDMFLLGGEDLVDSPFGEDVTPSVLALDVSLGDDNSPTDTLTVQGDAAGIGLVQVTNIGGQGALTSPDGIGIITIEGDNNLQLTLDSNEFSTEGDPIVSASIFGYRLIQGEDGNFALTSFETDDDRIFTPTASALESLPSVIMGIAPLRGFQDRIGGRLNQLNSVASQSLFDPLATTQGVPGGNNGLFLEFIGQTETIRPGNSTSGTVESKSRSFGMLVGLDTVLTDTQYGTWYGTISGFGLTSDTDVQGTLGSRDIDTDTLGINLSATWVGESGLYFEGQAQFGFGETEIASNTGTIIGSGIDSQTISGSLEVGKTFELGGGMSVTPQAQLIHSVQDIDSFVDNTNTTVTFSQFTETTARLGIQGEIEQDGLTLFGLTNLTQDFDNSSSSTVSGVNLDQGGQDTRLEVGLGLSGEVGANFTISGSVRYESGISGSGTQETTSANLGFRLDF